MVLLLKERFRQIGMGPQEEGDKDDQGLENMSCEERLKELYMLSLEK